MLPVCPKCNGRMMADPAIGERNCINCGYTEMELPAPKIILGAQAEKPPIKRNLGKFPCPQCGRVLKSAKWLANHIEVVHPPAPPVETSLNHTIQKGEEAFAKVELLESEPRVVTITIRIEL